MSEHERREKEVADRGQNDDRRKWSPPKLDKLDVGETAGGGRGVPDGKAGDAS